MFLKSLKLLFDFFLGSFKKNSNLEQSKGVVPDPLVSVIPVEKSPPQTQIKKEKQMLSTEKLLGSIPDVVLNQINPIAGTFNITTDLRLAHFLAQCAHESGDFKVLRENLNYNADGLLKIFGKKFDASSAAVYAHNPEKIANKVYADRLGNGNEASGDGWKYAGKGFIQLTGKVNYGNFSRFINEDCVANPELVATKYPLASAAFFFKSNSLWSICDKGADYLTLVAVTKRVNGGTIGLADREAHFKKYLSLLNINYIGQVTV